MSYSKNIFIHYGFAEGRLVARNFINAASKNNYGIVSDHEKADIVIAHSAGCYDLPNNLNSKMIILIGPPTLSVDTRTVLTQILKKLAYEYKQIGLTGFFIKNLPNVLYALNLPRNLRLRTKTLARNIPSKNVIIIRNQLDPFNDPHLLQHNAIDINKISLPGSHDDIWLNPEPYLDIIESIYGK